MNKYIRICGSVVLGVGALFAPFWLYGIGAVVYICLVRNPYELLVISACIDATFGESLRGVWYMYTLYTSVVFLVCAYIRPHVSLNS